MENTIFALKKMKRIRKSNRANRYQTEVCSGFSYKCWIILQQCVTGSCGSPRQKMVWMTAFPNISNDPSASFSPLSPSLLRGLICLSEDVSYGVRGGVGMDTCLGQEKMPQCIRSPLTCVNLGENVIFLYVLWVRYQTNQQYCTPLWNKLHTDEVPPL